MKLQVLNYTQLTQFKLLFLKNNIVNAYNFFLTIKSFSVALRTYIVPKTSWIFRHLW